MKKFTLAITFLWLVTPLFSIDFFRVHLKDTMAGSIINPPKLLLELPSNYILIESIHDSGTFWYLHPEDIRGIEERGGEMEGFVFKHGMFLFKLSGLSGNTGYFPDKKIFNFEQTMTYGVKDVCKELKQVPQYRYCKKHYVHNTAMFEIRTLNQDEKTNEDYNFFMIDIGMNYDTWVYTIIYQGVTGKPTEEEQKVWKTLMSSILVQPKLSDKLTKEIKTYSHVLQKASHSHALKKASHKKLSKEEKAKEEEKMWAILMDLEKRTMDLEKRIGEELNISHIPLYHLKPNFGDSKFFSQDVVRGNDFLTKPISKFWQIEKTNLSEFLKTLGDDYYTHYSFQEKQKLVLNKKEVTYNKYLRYITNTNWEKTVLEDGKTILTPPTFLLYEFFFNDDVLVFYTIEHRLSKKDEEKQIKNLSENLEQYKDPNYLRVLEKTYGKQRSEKFRKFYKYKF